MCEMSWPIANYRALFGKITIRNVPPTFQRPSHPRNLSRRLVTPKPCAEEEALAEADLRLRIPANASPVEDSPWRARTSHKKKRDHF
jgi:hypothetical protein